MKKTLSILIGTILLGTTSCVREMADPVEKYDRYLVDTEDISFDETRTVADNQGRVLWHNGDLVSVFEKVSYQSRYKYLGGNGTSGGELSLESTPETATGTEVSYYYAAYPYELENGMDNDENLILRFHQEQVSGYRSFGRGDNLMVSISENNRFHFKNAGSYLVLRLWGEGFVSSITMTGNSGEYISGDVKVAQSMNGDPEITVLSGRQYSSMGYKTYTSITLDCVDPEYGPVELVNDSNQYEEFWFVVPPTTFENGASFLVTDPNGRTCTVSIGSRFTLTRGRAQPARREVVFTTEVTSVSLDATEATLAVGKTKTLVATVLPENATDKTVTWTSSDETVATVDETGKVTALKVGSATITASAGEKTATCTISVIPVGVTGVTLDKEELSLKPGEISTLTATVLPENAADKSVTWASTDTDVAAVDANGTVTAKSVGTATVTVTTTDGWKTAACTVSVSPIEVTGVSLNKTSMSLTKGSTETLTATVTPSDATNKSVTWTSSNTSVATVDSNGKVTAVGGGSATITAAAGGKSAICSVTVTVPVTGVSLNKTSLSLTKGSTETLTATISPSDATNKSMTWTSSNTSVATVDASGKVTAVAVGSATITVKTSDGNKTATCALTVTPIEVSSITLNKTSVSIKVESTTTLSATVMPADAADKTVTWSSSNAAVATVSNSGVVTGVKAGTATITATAHDGSGVTASCSVTVVGVSSIAIYSEALGRAVTSIDLYPYETHDLDILCKYSNGTNEVVSGSAGYWQIVSDNVATCTFGLITAVRRGSSTVVTVGYQSRTASCTINVLDPAPSEAIDLGLSVKWGNRNLCATSITADGRYYSVSDILNYNNNSGMDVSVSLSGGEYRTPTKTEMQELIDGCNLTQTTIDGVTGALFTSKTNGNSIFFPNTGMYMSGYQVPDIYYPTPEIEPCYWTSTPYNYTNESLYRIRWYINPGSYYQVSGPYIPFIDVGGKQYKYPIRPVYNK